MALTSVPSGVGSAGCDVPMQFDLGTRGDVFGVTLLQLAWVYATCWAEYCGSNLRDVYLPAGVGLASLVDSLMVFCIG